MIDKKKIAILSMVAVLVAGLFWSQSRLPALDEKSQMGQRTNITAIAFDIIYPVSRDQPFLERVTKTSINWSYTNWKGMTFGIVFGAVLLSFLRALPRSSSQNRLLNSIKGLLGGVPLSVCVNCATPIAQGMHHVGIRLETVLSTLMSSPTLNIIVLTMAFSLLPFYFAFIKVAGTIIFIVCLVPLMVKFTEKYSKPVLNEEKITGYFDSALSGFDRTSDRDKTCDLPRVTENWFQALSEAARELTKNLIFIIKIALPLMILAGILGSLVIEAVPFDQLSGLTLGLSSILIVSLVGAFLPVPIAFDVLITAVLLSAGFPAGLAMALLFSLGIFSIYPALIIAKNISLQLSAVIFVAVVSYAVLIGSITQLTSDEIKIADAVLITKELRQENEQNRKETFVLAKSECDLDENGIKDQALCLQSFFDSGLFGDVDRTLCENLLEPGSESQNMCASRVEFVEAQEQSVKTNSFDPCQSLKNDSLRNQCYIHLINSLKPNFAANKLCGQLIGRQYQSQCKIGIIFSRIDIFANEEACDLPLPIMEKRRCLSTLTAHNVAENKDINLCLQIENSMTQKHCLLNVAVYKVRQLHDYAICEKLPIPMRGECNDLVSSSKGEALGDPAHCGRITDEALNQQCKIKAVIHKVQMRISDKQLASLNEREESEASPKFPSTEANKKSSHDIKKISWKEHYKSENISILYTEHFKQPGENRGKFKKISGSEIGLEIPWNLNFTELIEPFMIGRGIASGDFNNDGWPDLVIPSNSGAYLYQNNGNGTFVLKAKLSLKHSLDSFLVTFVDINNDGWQDLFVSAYGGNNYFFINKNGAFNTSNNNIILLSDENRVLTMATGFADWDRDGDLDFILGNWSSGVEKGFRTQHSSNHWVVNDDLKFKTSTPSELSGETLSVLLSDVNNDSYMDMLVANDVEVPDLFYFGGEKNKFSAVSPEQNIFPETSLNTMSYESADFNNDLLLDIFSTDMSFDQTGKNTYCPFLTKPEDQEKCEWLLKGNEALQRYNISWCNRPANQGNQKECLSAMALRVAHRDNNRELCRKIPKTYSAQKELCENITRETEQNPNIPSSKYHMQKISNKLLINTNEGVFLDKTEAMNIGRSYWSWNAKAADLDNDEWQDIYVVNGYKFGDDKKVHSNILFHNKQGKSFDRAESEFGLEDFINTTSYTYSDIDLDGDIDIITHGLMAGPTLFLNEGFSNNSISFALRDFTGNRFCVGCKVIIHYNQGKSSQIRELKLSGGFQSFDDPVIHFGLGEYTKIDGIEVHWSTGEHWKLGQPFPANRRYKIARRNN